MKKYTLLILVLSGFLLSCSQDDAEPENQELDCSTLNDTYESSIKAIIDSNCATSGCHDGTNPRPSYKNYQNVFNNRNNIKARVVNGSMPPPSRPDLSQEQIDMIDCWVSNGAPE